MHFCEQVRTVGRVPLVERCGRWFGFAQLSRRLTEDPALASVGMAVGKWAGTAISFAIVSVAMAIGGLVARARVLDTLAQKSRRCRWRNRSPPA